MRTVLRLAAGVAVLAVTAADALASAAAGTRPLTLRARSWVRSLADAYERAAHPEVIDAEIVDDDEERVRR
ncbi:hypothetical protein ACFQZ2_12285 [Streptomonospora algeriensis]|uniref:Uncharacterized protein n=1 Tax=Streptomonospora algeriensis TaxID=995084 RepID=A0ABW3BH62_9ACTN